MSYKTVPYDREKLYEEVWSIPMSRLAKQYGLSDVGLAKVCKKLNIPRPPRGYWAKLEFGKTVKKRPKLPPAPKGNEVLTVSKRVPEVEDLDEDTQDQLAALLASEEHSRNQIRVKKRLAKPHPLVEETQRILTGKRKFRWNDDRRFRHLDIDVSRELLPRAQRIMDAVINALEKRGFEVTLEKYDHKFKTKLKIFEEQVGFRLREVRKQVRVEDESSYRRVEYVHTGKLELQLSFYPHRSIREGKKPLEERLNAFIVV